MMSKSLVTGDSLQSLREKDKEKRFTHLDIPSLVHRIGSVSHFRNLSIADLKTIVMSGQILRFKAGETICIEDQPGSGLFVLFSGEVNLCRMGCNGQSSILFVVRPVIMFNEVSVLDEGSNIYTAVAVADCITWQLTSERFQYLVERYPQLGLSLLKVMAKRTRSLVSFAVDVSFRSVMGRTAKVLLDISEQGKVPINRRDFTNQFLAAKTATVPEAVCRSLRVLRQHEIISTSRASIKIISPEQLAFFADDGPGGNQENGGGQPPVYQNN
jgi:CRP/FNR family transcriptional regulator